MLMLICECGRVPMVKYDVTPKGTMVYLKCNRCLKAGPKVSGSENVKEAIDAWIRMVYDEAKAKLEE